MFALNWLTGFRGEDFKNLANQKQELPMVAMFVNGSGQNEQSIERTFHRCFLPSFTRVECTLFNSPCQRQCELLPSLGVRRPLTFHILIFSSETPQQIKIKSNQT
jgi:hypothetical protein